MTTTTATTLDRLIADRQALADLCDNGCLGKEQHEQAFADLMAVEAQIAAAPIASIADLAAKVLMALDAGATIEMQAAVAADARRILGQITH